MKLKTYNLNELFESAKIELDNLDLTEPLSVESHSRIKSLLESFLIFQESGWKSFGGITMEINFEKIPDELYMQFFSIMKKFNMPISKMFNIVMKEVVKSDNFENAVKQLDNYYTFPPQITLTHLHNLSINSQNLTEIEGKISFSHITNINFENDIKEELFLEKIHSINHCNSIVFPNSYSKIAVLSKIKFCNEIQFDESLN